MIKVHKNLHLEHTKNQTQVTIKQTSVVLSSFSSLACSSSRPGAVIQDDYPGAGCTLRSLLGRCRGRGRSLE